ncbi:MAG: hypothetical protein AUI15_26275 [Actinobacteria bacterium 13_2_20CM_2_66_6]|nr:MAG: hypothetical protein AUI15_26275 [Actinobacteria bacterium 13_2_20CM_2_66_6]
MRIVSLLPSATETLFALGLGEQLVAVTHECDYPPEAAALPVVTRSTLAQVMDDLSPIPVLRQHPHTLDDVLRDIEDLASACQTDASSLMSSLRERVAAAAEKARARRRVRGVFLEWLDPPYPAGHWTPDILSLAGIDDPLARPGTPSSAVTWSDVAAVRPEVLVLAPCGWGLERARQEAAAVADRVDAVGATRVLVLDGSAYFNRPGPRLVDSLEVLVDSLVKN